MPPSTTRNLVRVGEHRQYAMNVGVRYGIVVEIEAGTALLARPTSRFGRSSGVGSLRAAAAGAALPRRAPCGRWRLRPSAQCRSVASSLHQASAWALRRSRIRPEYERRRTHRRQERMVLLHAAFFVTARHRHRAGFITIVSCKAQQCRMEADRIAALVQDGTFQIIVE